MEKSKKQVYTIVLEFDGDRLISEKYEPGIPVYLLDKYCRNFCDTEKPEKFFIDGGIVERHLVFHQ